MTHPERKERRARIAAYVREGHSVAEAMEAFGVQGHMVHRSCRENEVPVPKAPGRRSSLSTYQILAALITTGDTIRQIAARSGVSPQYVSQLAHRARTGGIPLHPSRPEVRSGSHSADQPRARSEP